MAEIDGVVIKETKYIASVVIVLSVVMQIAFALAGKWNYTVLLGNILTGSAAVLNFLFMGITVQKAVSKEKDAAKSAMKASLLYRTLFMTVVVIIGAALPVFNLWAVVIPIFFPRIAIAFRTVTDKKTTSREVQTGEK